MRNLSETKLPLPVFIALAAYATATTVPEHHYYGATTPLPLSSVLVQRGGGCLSSTNCAKGECCSQFGYCGTSAEYCGSGSEDEKEGNDSGNRDHHIHEDSVNGSIFQFGDASRCHSILREYGACGISTYFQDIKPDASFVAMPAAFFDQHGSSQHNQLCGKIITVKHNGVTRTAIVADRNYSKDNSIDMCLDLWTAFGGQDNDGTLIHDITFDIAL